jgi:hypothetical protein
MVEPTNALSETHLNSERPWTKIADDNLALQVVDG